MKVSGGLLCALLLAVGSVTGFFAHGLSAQPAKSQAAGSSVPTLAQLAPVAPVVDCATLTGADVAAALGSAVGAKVSITSAARRDDSGPVPFCAVQGVIAPNIGFAVKLPLNGWTQRYLQVGCGGLCGTVSLRADHATDCEPVTTGAAVIASTDMGHGNSPLDQAQWGNDPQLRKDFAYRGVHLTAVATKALIARFYGQAPRYSYFSGCSDGGREALIEAQRFPQDFDGIAAGAPAMNFQVQNTFYHAWQARSNMDAQGRYIMLAAKLPALHRAAVAECDARDGLKDGQITDPRICRFDPAVIACKAGAAPSDECLTAAEVAVVRKLYQGPRDAQGHRFTIGGPQVGSELSWRGVFVPDGPDGRVLSPSASIAVIKYLAFQQNPPESTTLADFRFDVATFDRLRPLHTLYDATDTNLAPFEKRGGKLLIYHGWSDPHISPINTVAYYEGVEKLLGSARTRAFARLFVFPGLYHCGGGDGPSDFDILTPLMAWVEKGRSPDVIVAGRAAAAPQAAGPGGAGGPGGPGGARPAMAPDPFRNALQDRPLPNAGGAKMDRTRPVYPYPAIARYSGTGSVDAAASFVAGAPLSAPGKSPDWEGRNFIAPYPAR